jgi:hypothetical protein
MTRYPVWVEMDSTNKTAFVRGKDAKALIEGAGGRPMWLPRRACWTTTEKTITELIARAEADGRRVHYSEMGGPV